MTSDSRHELDLLIFGGGASGLWLLDVLRRRGFACALIEKYEVGTGQTICSQGIIHGGVKYALAGAMTSSAANVSDMPELWRKCLAGDPPGGHPDLRGVEVRAEYCHLWRTKSLKSKLAMTGASLALAVKPQAVATEARPAVLRDCPGSVMRIDEQVIDPRSLLATLAARNRDHIIRGGVDDVPISAPIVVLAAGAGNAELRESFGLSSAQQQLRPLHMIVARGDLPELNGHRIDGNRTRLTITTERDSAGQTYWHIGGQIAEDGVEMESLDLIHHAVSELRATIPGFDPPGIQWMTYRIDRAEAARGGGVRPDDVQILNEAAPNNPKRKIITAWPTKLALVPRLVERIVGQFGKPSGRSFDPSVLRDHDRPEIATPPWRQENVQWISAA